MNCNIWNMKIISTNSNLNAHFFILQPSNAFFMFWMSKGVTIAPLYQNFSLFVTFVIFSLNNFYNKFWNLIIPFKELNLEYLLSLQDTLLFCSCLFFIFAFRIQFALVPSRNIWLDIWLSGFYVKLYNYIIQIKICLIF